MITLAELAVGRVGIIKERMEEEVRTVLYLRRAGASPDTLPGFVPTYRVYVTQGVPGEERLRYFYAAGLFPYPQNSFGRTPCELWTGDL